MSLYIELDDRLEPAYNRVKASKMTIEEVNVNTFWAGIESNSNLVYTGVQNLVKEIIKPGIKAEINSTGEYISITVTLTKDTNLFGE